MENLPMMHGSKFKAISRDLPFIEDASQFETISKTLPLDRVNRSKSRYSQFWIDTDVLNIRSGPGFEYDIISETYYGGLVFAFAKKGDWIAIRKGFAYEDKVFEGTEVEGFKLKPRWVNIKYLSSNRINNPVDIKVLKNKCDFETYGNLNLTEFSLRTRDVYEPCAAVRDYLHGEILLSKKHDYHRAYNAWRKSQELPEKYNLLACSR